MMIACYCSVCAKLNADSRQRGPSSYILGFDRRTLSVDYRYVQNGFSQTSELEHYAAVATGRHTKTFVAITSFRTLRLAS